jgi:adenosylmethionine-8-amino-7-oxononanoate aminotransferase
VTRAPFPRSARFAERFAEAALDAGLVVWPNIGQADGVNGDLAMLAPPFVVTHEEIDLIVERFGSALRATSERIGAMA